jgi:predicted RNA binding protein YcfA (HicA-like mRNA interferase family)
MKLSPKYVIQLLEKEGYIYKRAKGSHQIYYNPVTRKTIIIPVHGRT